MTEDNENAPATPEEQQQDNSINIQTGYDTNTNQAVVMLKIGRVAAAVSADTARQLAMSMICAARDTELLALERQRPVIQQATAAAMAAIRKH